jgi:phage gpG-like protein
MATITHQIHPNTVQVLLTSPSGGVTRDMLRRGLKVQMRAKTLCPVDTGRLRSSITLKIQADGIVIGTNVTYAPFVHEGTGIYGPRHTPILPKRGRYLVFTPKGATRPVFARSVRGVPPRPFLRMALLAARD